MEFLEKTFDYKWLNWFVFEATGISRLSQLIRERIDLWNSFAIYQWESLDDDTSPIVGHAWEYRWELLAPVISSPEDPYASNESWRLVYMLDVDDNIPKIIQVPTWIPLVGMRDSYRYHCTLNKFFTTQSVGDILAWLRGDWWTDFRYTKQNTGAMDFTPISKLRKHIVQL